ncbi:MAG TPA: NfuA family Fe-S biogenesis protein [Rudaea sp.]
MLTISENAQNHFRRLIEQQGIDELGIRLRALHPGTPKADCHLEFCETVDLAGDEWSVECAGFTLYVDAASVPFLDSAQIDYQTNATGGELTVRAPKLKGTPPDAEASLVERVRYLIDSEINPQIASHGGRVSLVEIDAQNAVYLQFGGGCHGCGMADVTLKQGIERTLRSRLPEISAVRDVTDHASGAKPYYSGHQGASAVR